MMSTRTRMMKILVAVQTMIQRNTILRFSKFKLPEYYDALRIPGVDFARALDYKDNNLSEFKSENEVDQIVVDVTLRIESIIEVNDENEEITFSARVILAWTDEVIKRSVHEKYTKCEVSRAIKNSGYKTEIKFDSKILQSIWKPDIYIENLVKIRRPEVTQPPISVSINPVTGLVTFETRMIAKMQCEMDLHYYPADTQTCNITLRSSTYPSEEITLSWNGTTLEDCGGKDFDFQIRDISDIWVKPELFRGGEIRNYDILTLKIAVRRKFSYHLIQTFFPSIFFIIITWLGFVLPQDMIEARIAISMTTLLTLTAMFASVRDGSPNVSYVRAIDIWMVACIFFVFLTLLEFTLLVWLQYIKKKMLKYEEPRKEFIDIDESKGLQLKAIDKWRRSSSVHQAKMKKQREIALRFTLVAKFIETYAFVIFTILFLTFCVSFWTWLLIGSEYFEWDNNHEWDKNNCQRLDYIDLSFFAKK